MRLKAIMLVCVTIVLLLVLPGYISSSNVNVQRALESSDGQYILQWQKSYGKLSWWSARYEGPQPVGDADNDGENELLIGGRDPFMRVMKWDSSTQTYYEQTRIVDPVFGIGYSFLGIPQPFGSATGFGIEDIDNDGENEIGIAWGRHFSAFKWNGQRYQKIGGYVIDDSTIQWGTTLDCIIGDCDNDGDNEVVVTGGYSSGVAEVVVLSWDGNQFIKESEWNSPGRSSVYFPWIEDVDEDGLNEIIINTDHTIVLNWIENEWVPVFIAEHSDSYPFGCVAKDSDNDGKPEIHVTFYDAYLKIYEYEDNQYHEKASFFWENEYGTIEAIDVGDVDNDGKAEVVVGTNYVHILEWNGNQYVDEYVITETHGFLAVTCVGDMDNDAAKNSALGAEK